MTKDKQTLPIPQYDQMTVDSLQHQIRSLDQGGVQQLLDYEREHGNRMPVKQVLQARIDQLAAGAEPTGGSDQIPNDAAAGDPTDTPGRVDAASAPNPPVNPPSQGVPTNPAQPRT